MGTRMRTRAASAATALGLMMSSLTPVLGRDGERVVQRGKASGTALLIMDGAPRAVKSLIRMR